MIIADAPASYTAPERGERHDPRRPSGGEPGPHRADLRRLGRPTAQRQRPDRRPGPGPRPGAGGGGADGGLHRPAGGGPLPGRRGDGRLRPAAPTAQPDRQPHGGPAARRGPDDGGGGDAPRPADRGRLRLSPHPPGGPGAGDALPDGPVDLRLRLPRGREPGGAGRRRAPRGGGALRGRGGARPDLDRRERDLLHRPRGPALPGRGAPGQGPWRADRRHGGEGVPRAGRRLRVHRGGGRGGLSRFPRARPRPAPRARPLPARGPGPQDLRRSAGAAVRGARLRGDRGHRRLGPRDDL